MFFNKFIKFFTVAVLATYVSNVSANEINNGSFSLETINSCKNDVQTRNPLQDEECRKTLNCIYSLGDECLSYMVVLINNNDEASDLVKKEMNRLYPKLMKKLYSNGSLVVHQQNENSTAFSVCTPHKNDPNLKKNGGTYDLCDWVK